MFSRCAVCVGFLRPGRDEWSRCTVSRSTAVLPKIPHSNCGKRVPNRPLRGRRGRFGTLLQLLECGSFGRTAVCMVCRPVDLPPPPPVALPTRSAGRAAAPAPPPAAAVGSSTYSQKSRSPIVAKECRIGLFDPAEADLEQFSNS